MDNMLTICLKTRIINCYRPLKYALETITYNLRPAMVRNLANKRRGISRYERNTGNWCSTLRMGETRRG